ncbi:ribosomal RNA-processing protein 8 [Gadus macrocephalus]|uniref:ribosomal RNA-processing protein 8 n=1 Tax=Gadus macrocephalus TaxID=80720 RepID=UPI0028CB67D9|nr:ribosomal RNA-processing protein 8 [Gadus macrocephalus]
MFLEDSEWNDDGQASHPTIKPVLPRPVQKSNRIVTFKPKSVAKKSLLRTLKSLGPALDQKSDHVQKDSDSEAEPESAPARPKRKKKRNRGRKKKDEAGTETAGPADVKKADSVPKKMKEKDSKAGSIKLKKTDSGNGQSKVTPEIKEENEMNRKQWKTKMKNKRKCKNKYREKELVVPKDTATENGTGEQQKADTSSSGKIKVTFVKTVSQNKAKQKESKPQKRKLTEPAQSISNTAEAQKPKLNKKPMKNTKVKETRRGKTEQIGSLDPEVPHQEVEVPHQEVEVPHQEVEVPQAEGEVQEEEEEEEEDDKQEETPAIKRQKMHKLQEERRRRERLRKMLHSKPDEPERPTEDQEEKEEEQEEVAAAPLDRSAALRSRMELRLEAARFRYINEVLYTSSSGEAKRMFSQDPEAFGVYHKGFTAQVKHWPANPVDAIIAYIHKKPASHVVADFGCGDCKIALSVKNKVHSFDLAPISDLVTVCDMAHVPLKDGSVHIAVFCLSLMGTNLIDFLAEANRVLVVGGILKIAEVASRFDDVRGFLTTLSHLGFKMMIKDTENSHFYSFDFIKTKDVSEDMKSSSLELRPCVYKKR